MTSLVPIDHSWDEEPCETYNPQEYIDSNLILKKPPSKLSKTEKKKFRKKEQIRFQKIEQNMACPSANVMLSHMKGEKLLCEFSKNEIATLPLEYLINYAPPLELLDVWGMLPTAYKSCFSLQVCLPCFRHYNINPSVQFDGPAQSQKKCIFCANV